ncbi:MAG: response regulator transcription factor [Mucilaginibacter polytrichastri]|nr:response regulator transcription factor [Mucilaginibacter polytrichastri]
MILNCIAVDDEPLALGLVCSFIEKTPFLKLTGKYSSAVAALSGLHEQKVDLIFLDIQMPDLSGIELARVLAQRTGASETRIVFTTAFNQFAIEGFKVDALDYLLKPFNYEEFLRAANKALSYHQRINPPKQEVQSAVQTEDYLFLKVEYQLVKVFFSDILYVEGLKDYAKVHLQSQEKPLLSLTSLKALEEKLPDGQFMRVHRSYIISLDKIRSVTRNTLQIADITIAVGDQYKEAFGAFLAKWI